MAGMAAAKTVTWGSRLSFIMASVGAAVGLGNFWRFPYTAGENGGGAFVGVYLICMLLIAVPLVFTELLVGRRGRHSAVGSTRQLSVEATGKPTWAIIGWLGMSATFLIVTFYSVIGGWVINYVVEGFTNGYATTVEEAGAVFDGLLADPWRLTLYHTLFMIITVAIPAQGVKGGIERAVNVLMPALFLLLFGLMVYGMFSSGFSEGVSYMFSFDFSKITPQVVLAATGQAFFSVGVGMAILITYGAYLDKKTNLVEAGLIVSLADTGVAIMAGLVIFPIVFTYGLDPAGGPGLIFVTLPVAFAQMGFGGALGSVFFLLIIVAAITSSIAIIEITVSWAEDKGFDRKKSAVVSGLIIWLLGFGTVFSFNEWSDFYPLGFIGLFEGKTIFDALDFITGQFMLTAGGLLLAIFGGWILSAEVVCEEFGWQRGSIMFFIYRVMCRFLIPPVIATMIISVLIG